MNTSVEVREMLNDDNTAGRCCRCNRPIKSGAAFAEIHFKAYGMECVQYAREAATQMPLADVAAFVMAEHRRKTSADTKAGLARRKARLTAEAQPKEDIYELLARSVS